MSNKKTTSKQPVALLGLAAIILSILLVAKPANKLLTIYDKPKQSQTEAKWQHVADVYQTTWEYTTPSRQDQIGFTITVEGDVIKDVKVTPYTKSEASIEYQTNFGKEINKIVVGKKLSEISSIDTVSGASGTTDHFKEAIAQLDKEI